MKWALFDSATLHLPVFTRLNSINYMTALRSVSID